MNPLEKLKNKLKVKPNVEEQVKQVEIVLPTKAEPVELRKVKIVDERNKEGSFNMAQLTEQLKEHKLSKVSSRIEPLKSTTIKPKSKSPMKRPLLKLVYEEKDEEEDEDEEEEEREDAGLEPHVRTDVERKEEDMEADEGEEKQQKTTGRRTKKPKKGVAVLSPEQWIDIQKIKTVSRLPQQMPSVNIKVSSYYMNNREIFVNFINSLFTPYRDEIMNDESDISCDTIGQASKNISLLTHQKLVRDYLNLYTPYRGLLLYHGLGSGKTATSIAIGEGMKTAKQVIVMTPASLRRNYIEEIKKFGDAIYRKNQHWEWISLKKNPGTAKTMSSVLNLTEEYIEKKGGAWFLNVKKESNIADLTANESKSLDDQLDEMIQTKYKFINYNGLRRDKVREMTDNFEKNIFDNSVVIIDEAHNFVSLIVNKITKEKEIPVNSKGEKEKVPFSLSLILYELLLNAQNTNVVLMTGTPIINYPNELGILFNILRGYIKTWEIPLDQKSSGSVSKEKLEEIFKREKILDYMEYSSSSKKITITRNPFGFDNQVDRNGKYTGVSNEPKQKATDKTTGKKIYQEKHAISDTDFERRIIGILRDNKMEVLTTAIVVHKYKALPDKLDDFLNRFIETGTGNVKNIDMFKRRILGLTSYFRAAQESLLPKYEKMTDYHVEKIPMSNYQFGVYEEARKQERKQEKSSKTKKGGVDNNGVFKEPSSTYRIFSRLYCNFVMPKPPGRPLPREDKIKGEGEGEGEGKDEEGAMEALYTVALKETTKKGKNDLEDVLEVEGDQIIDGLADTTYEERIKKAIDYLKEHEEEYLSPKGLETYSPKFLNILENIQDKDHIGLHLVYSQFRTLEGIGIFKMVLEANGFAQFKIKKDFNGTWQLDIPDDDLGKPMFALYTGTESAEEKEVVRTIYNSQWSNLEITSPSIYKTIKKIANNNNVGEIIKVFMITASGAEGINLRNTRYVHIMEPYWNPARLEQVIGRARRICSHKDLPEALQTVEVFMYLMTFSQEQIKSDASIELKNKDLSKKMYVVNPEKPKDMKQIPFTSDEALYEISTIKAEISGQLLTAIKESSIDCAIYAKRGNKEQLNCIQFGNPSSSAISYKPSIGSEEPDKATSINKNLIEWRGDEVSIKGKKYIYREINSRLGNLYDYDSYMRALENPAVEPVLLGTLETNERGQQVVKKI
jgi:hypothetical protein